MSDHPPISQETASYLLELSSWRQDWIERRTECLTFDSDTTLTRTSICDIVVSDTARGQLPLWDGRLPLPISELARLPAMHVKLELLHEGIPILRRGQERAIIATALTANLLTDARVTAKIGELLTANVTKSIADELYASILLRLDPALRPPNEGLRSLFETIATLRPDLRGLSSYYYGRRIIFALAPVNDSGVRFAITEVHSESIRVWRAGPWHLLLVLLRTRDPNRSTYAMWQLRSQPPPQNEHLLTFSDGSAMRINSYTGHDAKHEHRKRWGWPWWVPDTYIVLVPIDSFLECRSYHTEVSCPSGLYIHKATLRLLNYDHHQRELIIIENDDSHPDRAHLHFSREVSRRQASDIDYYAGSLRLVLRPSYHNGLRSGLNMSVISVLTLWLMTFIVGWPAANFAWQPNPLHIGQFNTGSIVALLLLAPTAVIASIVRRDEHHLTKRVFGRYRMRLAMTGTFLFFSALALAVNVGGRPLFIWLLASSVISSILLAMTLLSAMYSRFRRPAS